MATPEGTVTGFRWSTRFVLLPFAFHGSCTRLTSTTEISRRTPPLDRLEVLAFKLSKRMDSALDRQLALIKQRVEAAHKQTPEALLEPDPAASDA